MLEEIVPSYARAVLRRSQYTEAQAVAARDVLLKITNMAVAHLARKVRYEVFMKHYTDMQSPSPHRN
jgi:hypothetical protein